MNTLQSRINKTTPNGVLGLYAGEYNERIEINKPVTIKTKHSFATIAGSSPTVAVNSDGVVLEKLFIICTEENGASLFIENKSNIEFKDVYVKGNVVGLDGEEGEWEIPDVMKLNIMPDKVSRNRFILLSPVSARIFSYNNKIIDCHPNTIYPGINEVEITIKELDWNNIIQDYLIIETMGYHLKRKILIYGNTIDSSANYVNSKNNLIWACKSADAGYNGNLFNEEFNENTISQSYDSVSFFPNFQHLPFYSSLKTNGHASSSFSNLISKMQRLEKIREKIMINESLAQAYSDLLAE